MSNICPNSRNILFALAFGAIGGGLFVTWATRAAPKMIKGMMQNMMAKMGEEGCDPAEM